MKIYYLLGRLSSPLQVAFFFAYNHLVHTPRSRVLVWNEDSEVLLVRNWGTQHQWSLPGGGVERGEEPIAAAKRELYEEVGVDLPLADFSFVTTIQYQYEAMIYRAQIPKATLPVTPHNPWEITATKWFSLEDLPTDLSPVASLVLKKLSKSN